VTVTTRVESTFSVQMQIDGFFVPYLTQT